MGQLTSSADISILDFTVLFDISNAVPAISITNTSTVINPGNLQWIFNVISPAGTPIHVATFDAPDINQDLFTVFNITEQIPQYLRQIEFSTNLYSVTVSVKDLAGNIYSLTKGSSLCMPTNNNGKNNFGVADIYDELKCGSGQFLIKDKTNVLYKGIVGSLVSSTSTLTYPKDASGNNYGPSVVNSIPALFAIRYEGDGYEIYVVNIYDYDLGDGFIVRVRYSFSKVFSVWCNITLQPLFCELELITTYLEKNCDIDNASTKQKQRLVTLANAKMLKAFTGIVQPLSGINVPATVEEIKELLGLEDCDCYTPSGISNIGSVLLSDAVLTVNKVCGDMLLSWTNDGAGNIVLNYQNTSYAFVTNTNTDSAAFSYGTAISGCNKTVALQVDMSVLAGELLTEIKSNQTLLNILNSVTQKAQLVCSGLDGKDVLDLSACDYSVDLDTSATGRVFKSITIAAATYNAPTGTALNDAPSIQTFLNSLALGAFVVAYNSSTNKTTITSAANPNAISTVTTTLAGVDNIAQVTNNCSLICNLFQLLINYLDTLSLVKIQSGQPLTICRFNDNGTVFTKDFLATDSAAAVSKYIADSFCNLTNYLDDKVLSCANLQALFASFTPAVPSLTGGDINYMSVNGKCQEVPLKNLALSVFQLVNSDADVKAAFCSIPPCATSSDCVPVSGLTSTLHDTTADFNWTAITGVTGYKWSLDNTSFTLVSTPTAHITGLTAATNYVFYIYPVYASGDATACKTSTAFTTTNTSAVCAAPTSVVINTITTTSFKASWAAVSGATGYQYSLNGGSFTSIGNVLTITPTGLTPNTAYAFAVKAIVGGTPCTQTGTASTTTSAAPTINISISNNSSIGVVVNSKITGADYFTPTSGAFPLNNGDTISGTHGSFSGQIDINCSVSSVGMFNATLIKNGTFVQCIDLGASHNFFNSYTFTPSDNIVITVSNGSCSA